MRQVLFGHHVPLAQELHTRVYGFGEYVRQVPELRETIILHHLTRLHVIHITTSLAVSTIRKYKCTRGFDESPKYCLPCTWNGNAIK